MFGAKGSVIYDISGISTRDEIWDKLDYLNPESVKLRVSTNQLFKEKDGYFIRELMANDFDVFLSIEKTRDILSSYRLARRLKIWMLGIKNIEGIKILEDDLKNDYSWNPSIVYETYNDVLNNLSRFDKLDGIYSKIISTREVNDIKTYAKNRDREFILINLYPVELLYGNSNISFYHLETPIL